MCPKILEHFRKSYTHCNDLKFPPIRHSTLFPNARAQFPSFNPNLVTRNLRQTFPRTKSGRRSIDWSKDRRLCYSCTRPRYHRCGPRSRSWIQGCWRRHEPGRRPRRLWSARRCRPHERNREQSSKLRGTRRGWPSCIPWSPSSAGSSRGIGLL